MRILFIVLLALYILALVFVAFFYRNPRRRVPVEPGYVAPADGRIVAVEQVYELDFLKSDVVQISIFMPIFAVHVNRSPMTGEVVFLASLSGTHFPLYHRETPPENTCHLMGLADEDVRILVKQVAGPLARRIVCEPKLGERLERGQVFGRVLLGSRVDVFLPSGVRVLVSEGDRVRAGETVLADG